MKANETAIGSEEGRIKGKGGKPARPWRAANFRARLRVQGGQIQQFTADRRSKVLRAWHSGASQDEIVSTYRVSLDTIYRWRRNGIAAMKKREAGGVLAPWEVDYADFAAQWIDAKGDKLTAWREQVGVSGDWRAQWALLCAAHPEVYSEKYRVEVMKLEADAPVRAAEIELKLAQREALIERTRIMVESFARGGTTFVLGAEAFVHGLLQPDQLSDGARAEVEAFCARLGIRFAHARELGFEPEDIAADEARVLLEADEAGVTTPVPRG